MPVSEVKCCDCMDFMAQFPDKFFDLAIVDPPYGLGDSVVNSGGRFKRYENKSGNWDTATPTKEYFTELERVSQNQIIWGGNYFIDKLTPTKCFLIWDKGQRDFSLADGEMAWTSFKKAARFFDYSRGQALQEGKIHPTQKPVALYKWLLMNYAKQGDKILDTHVGSASSLLACYDMGFDYIGFEIDEDYYKAAQKRIEENKAQIRMVI